MTPRRGALNREAILGAAHDVIAERGYHGATTAEICRRAEVSSGTFFHYFPKKIDVLIALLTAEPGGDDEQPLGLDDLLAEVVSDALRPTTAAFMREVSTLTSLPEVAGALTALDEHRRRQVSAAVADARRTGRANSEADPAAQEVRLRWVVDGYESLVAGGEDAEALAPQLRELAALVLA